MFTSQRVVHRQAGILHCVCPPVDKAAYTPEIYEKKLFFSSDSFLDLHYTEVRKQRTHITSVLLFFIYL